MPRLDRRMSAWISRRVPPLRTDVQAEPGLSEDRILASEDYGALRWARGFLLTDLPHPVPVGHWKQVRLGDRWLSYDPRTPFAVARARGSWVALLGRAIDLDDFGYDQGRIAASLLRSRLVDREALLDRLESLSGRYAVFDGDHESATAQSDAASLRSVFYEADTSSPCVASHAALVAERIGAGPSDFSDPRALRLERNAYALPGRATPFEGVVALTPNTELDLRGGTVRRVFPRHRQESRSADAVAEALLPLLQGQLAVLTEHEHPQVSLTAGLDSRTTLALSRPFADRLEYFTYRIIGSDTKSRRLADHDAETAAELARRLGFRHHRIDVDRHRLDERLEAVMERNSLRGSNRALAAAHRGHPILDGVHVRSNLYEIGQAVWRAKGPQPQVLKPGRMTRMLTRRKGHNPQMRAAFAEFIDATDFNRAQRLYDPLDLFHWEHKAGTWLNAHLTESDIAFDTFILINSRRIYRLLLSAPLADRMSKTVYLELIRRSWPEALDVPVNGEAIAYSSVDQ